MPRVGTIKYLLIRWSTRLPINNWLTLAIGVSKGSVVHRFDVRIGNRRLIWWSGMMLFLLVLPHNFIKIIGLMSRVILIRATLAHSYWVYCRSVMGNSGASTCYWSYLLFEWRTSVGLLFGRRRMPPVRLGWATRILSKFIKWICWRSFLRFWWLADLRWRIYYGSRRPHSWALVLLRSLIRTL